MSALYLPSATKIRASLFNQTGQLGLECFQMFSDGVFTIIHSGRDE